MDIRKIKKLIELLAATDVIEIEIKESEQSLRLSRQKNIYKEILHQEHKVHEEHNQNNNQNGNINIAQALLQPKGCRIHSPMVGTMYMARSPESPPFVILGQQIRAGDVLCIIEAMKMFNEIESDKTGKIIDILVKNGEPVEYDQPLFVIEE